MERQGIQSTYDFYGREEMDRVCSPCPYPPHPHPAPVRVSDSDGPSGSPIWVPLSSWWSQKKVGRQDGAFSLFPSRQSYNGSSMISHTRYSKA